MLNNTKTQSCFLESRAQIVTEQKHCNRVVHQKGLFPVSVNTQLVHNSLIQSISQSRKSTSQTLQNTNCVDLSLKYVHLSTSLRSIKSYLIIFPHFVLPPTSSIIAKRQSTPQSEPIFQESKTSILHKKRMLPSLSSSLITHTIPLL